MVRKTTNLGVAFLAAAAFSVVATSIAQAGHFEVGAKPAVLTGHRLTDQEHIFTLTAKSGKKYTASCSTATLEGTVQTQTFDEVTLTPTFGKAETTPTGCSLFGQEAHVKVNGCKYTLTGAGQGERTFLLDIVGCTTGKQIEFKSNDCTLDIGEQNGLVHMIAFTGPDTGGIKDVRLGTSIMSVTATQTGVGCPDGDKVVSKISFVGDTVIKAFQDNGMTQVTKKIINTRNTFAAPR